MAVVLTIPDLHAPWQHPDALDFLRDVQKEWKPTVVVCIGDEIDAHAFSHWAKETAAPGPDDELARAKDALKPLFKLFPAVRVCTSNHTLRPWKRAQEAGLPQAMMRSVREIIGAPRGWTWRDEWVIDGVTYFHGDGFGGDSAHLKAAMAHRRSVVMGHVHSVGGVQWTAGKYDTIFGMCTGCLIDGKAVCFNYARTATKRPVLGTGIVADGIPTFIPLGGAR